MTELIPANDVSLGSLAEKIQYSETISASDLLPVQYRGKPANVMIAVETGAALGLPAIHAINSINVINGKPAMSADLMASLVRKAGHKLRITQNGMSVTAELVRADDPDFTFSVTWDQAKAQTAGLWGSATWKKYPDQMLRARAITEVCRQGASDALMGVIYTPEELGGTETQPVPRQGNSLRDRVPAKPAQEPAPEVETPKPITQAQLKKLHACFSDLGVKDDETKHRTYKYVTKRDIESSNDLTHAEAIAVIDYLEQRLAETEIVEGEVIDGQEALDV